MEPHSGGLGTAGLVVNVACALLAAGCAAVMPRAVGAFAPFEGEPVRRPVPPRWVFAVATGGAVALLAWRMWDRPWLPAYLYLTAVGVLLAAVDLRVHRLPDPLVLPSYPVLAALLAASYPLRGGVFWEAGRPRGAAVGAAVLLGLFGALYLVRRSGLGLGDVKLVGLLGGALGWLGGLPLALFGLFAGLLCAGLYAMFLLATGRARRTDPIAYGPHLLLGAYLAMLLAAT